jgi:hypothetical protein
MTDKSEKYQHVFESVRALYLVIRETQDERGLPLRRAAVRSNGEVAAESIDFLCDVELKAKRVLFPVEFNMFKEGLDLPVGAKTELGEVFHRCRLGVGGDYKSLYFHVKQVQDGQTLSGVEYSKPAEPSPSLEEYDRKTL